MLLFFIDHQPYILIALIVIFSQIQSIINAWRSKIQSISSNEIQINYIVEHKVFGKGKVLKIEGTGENSKLTIKFYNNVVKKLISKYANLKIIKG